MEKLEKARKNANAVKLAEDIKRANWAVYEELSLEYIPPEEDKKADFVGALAKKLAPVLACFNNKLDDGRLNYSDWFDAEKILHDENYHTAAVLFQIML